MNKMLLIVIMYKHNLNLGKKRNIYTKFIFWIVKDHVPVFEDREKDRERSNATKTFKLFFKLYDS